MNIAVAEKKKFSISTAKVDVTGNNALFRGAKVTCLITAQSTCKVYKATNYNYKMWMAIGRSALYTSQPS